jgi:hypothetical protein
VPQHPQARGQENARPSAAFFAASYQAIAARRGKNATTAIARKLLTRAYHLLTGAASGGAPS